MTTRSVLDHLDKRMGDLQGQIDGLQQQKIEHERQARDLVKCGQIEKEIASLSNNPPVVVKIQKPEEGEWFANRVPDENAAVDYGDGKKYVGNTRNGLPDTGNDPNNKGTMKVNEITYVAQWQAGKLHGEGVVKFPNGDIYRGTWNQGKLVGVDHVKAGVDNRTLLVGCDPQGKCRMLNNNESRAAKALLAPFEKDGFDGVRHFVSPYLPANHTGRCDTEVMVNGTKCRFMGEMKNGSLVGGVLQFPQPDGKIVEGKMKGKWNGE